MSKEDVISRVAAILVKDRVDNRYEKNEAYQNLLGLEDVLIDAILDEAYDESPEEKQGDVYHIIDVAMTKAENLVNQN